MDEQKKFPPEQPEIHSLNGSSYLRLTLKGRTVLAMWRSGLFGEKDFPECVEAFEPFWTEFSRMLEEELKDREAVLCEYPKDETERPGDKRGRYGYLVLIPVSTFSIGLILCAFLEAFGLCVFLFALALSFFSAVLPVVVKRYLS